MTWQSLLTSGKVKAHVTSKRELDDLRAVIDRDLADAAIPALSSDRRFATAYNAALQTATMIVHCAGYRTDGSGHHKTTFEAAELAMGSASAQILTYFDSCRRKRNTVDYDRAHIATETESATIITQASFFLQLAEAWVDQNYPALKKT